MVLNFLQPVVGGFAESAKRVPTVALMHAAFRNHKLKWRFINCEIAPSDLGAAVAGARAMHWRGFVCSDLLAGLVPPYLDRLSDAARMLGSAPIVTNRDGVLVGHNTDGQDILAAIRDMRDPSRARVVVLGAGADARAAAVELALAGVAEVAVADRDAARAEALARAIAGGTRVPARVLRWQGCLVLPGQADIVIASGTSIAEDEAQGLTGFDPSTLAPGTIVADLSSGDGRSALIAAASARGCRTLRGRDPGLARAAAAFREWTGIAPDRGEMQKELDRLGL